MELKQLNPQLFQDKSQYPTADYHGRITLQIQIDTEI
jgi:hypothetical protein